MEPQLKDSVLEWTEDEHLLFYRFILENMADAAYCITPKGGFNYVNEAACRMLGYKKSEFCNLTVDAFFPPNHVRAWKTFWVKLKEDLSINFESVHQHKSGRLVDVEVQTTYLAFMGKEFCYAIVKDVSERKANQEKLTESERKLRLFLENSLDAFFLTAPDGSILFVNQAACNMFGRTAEEICIVGRSGILDLNDPRLAPSLEERAKTGVFKGELTGKRKDGTFFPMEVSSSYFYNDDGSLRTSMVIRDITERKKAEEILKESEARLAELNATKDNFSRLFHMIYEIRCTQCLVQYRF
ncbi:MAG: PAS domain S-box protein [Ignavibacteriales bacterium]|nr:PAS domain S-box protein [Ignavibacteriales bacterium]